jgi:hypothetical protein
MAFIEKSIAKAQYNKIETKNIYYFSTKICQTFQPESPFFVKNNEKDKFYVNWMLYDQSNFLASRTLLELTAEET